MSQLDTEGFMVCPAPPVLKLADLAADSYEAAHRDIAAPEPRPATEAKTPGKTLKATEAALRR